MPPVKKSKSKKKVEVVEKEEKPSPEPVISGQLHKKLEKQRKRQIKKERGIVLIKNLPYGFFEQQIKKYFDQFGRVTRLRLVRSRRTGGSKGFAYVEFEYPQVAQVAAETMNNYLMFHKLVKAFYIPPEKQMYNYFKTSVRKLKKNKSKKPVFISSRTALVKRKVTEHNNWTDETYKQRSKDKLKKLQTLNQKYAHLGIDFTNVCLGINEEK